MDIETLEELFESPFGLIDEAKDAYERFLTLSEQESRTMKLEYIEDNSVYPSLTVHKIRLYGTPSTAFRRAAYRVVSDTRNALDQAVFQASAALGSNPKRTKIYFPFAKDPADFENLFDGRKSRYGDVHKLLIPLLREFQPWWHDDKTNTGDNLLRTLGKLSGPNKHQVMIEFGPQLIAARGSYKSEGMTIWGVFPPVNYAHLKKDKNFQFVLSEERGTTDFVFSVNPKGTEIKFSHDLKFSMCAKHAVHFKSYPLDSLLNDIIHNVQNRVERIKEFCHEAIIAT